MQALVKYAMKSKRIRKKCHIKIIRICKAVLEGITYQKLLSVYETIMNLRIHGYFPHTPQVLLL